MGRWYRGAASRVFDDTYRSAFDRFGKSLDTRRSADHTQRTGLLHMIGTLGPGGSERQLVNTLGQLAGMKSIPLSVAVRFLQTDDQRFFLPHLQRLGIPVHEMAWSRPVGDSTDLRAFLAAVKHLPASLADVGDYIDELSRSRPALVHLWLDEVNIKGGLAAVVTGVPRVVLGMRSLPPIHFGLHQPYMREGYRWLATQRGVSMINNSEAGARAYEQWLGLEPQSIRVVRNGYVIDDAVLDPYIRRRSTCRGRLGIPNDAPLIGAVMRLSEEKRPILWVDIAGRVKRLLPGCRFLIVGDGPMRLDVVERCRRSGLSDAVHFTGYEQDALACIAAMDLLLLTSRAEGLPNVLVEAQMLRVPVVSTNAGGAAETIDRGRSGFILEKDSPDLAANVIARALTDRKWYAAAQAASRAFARKHFGIDRMIRELLDVYGDGTPQDTLRNGTGISHGQRRSEI